MIQVPKDVIIEPGETVAIPDYGPSVLGVVVSVDDKNSSSFTKVYVAHPVSIYDARYVEVRIFAPEVSQ